MNTLQLKGEYLELSKAQDLNAEGLLARQNVTGIAVGHKIKDEKETGDVCLTVFVESKVEKAYLNDSELIPAKIGKYKTDVVESGILFAGSEITLRNKIRPAKGGYSVGHYRVTAGTIGACVKDAVPAVGVTGKYYILSNNHVLANVNDAFINDPILQPGSFDGGTNPADIIARLSRFVPIHFNPLIANQVDCAIAEGNFDDLDREIFWTGYVNGTNPLPTVGMQVQKCGRTTGHTTGTITGLNATVNVNYGGGRVARFVNQIITSNMSAGGDSGSLICDMNNKAVGLLFAGSNLITIANPIGLVMSRLGIKFI
jgi:hypothetical protein